MGEPELLKKVQWAQRATRPKRPNRIFYAKMWLNRKKVGKQRRIRPAAGGK
jgi:hypothetical protein